MADQSKNPSSPLRRFLDEHLPNRAGVTDAWARSLETAPWTGRDLADGWDHLGCALELRIGLDLVARPAPRHLLSYLPADQYEVLLTTAGFRHETVGALPHSGTTDPSRKNWVRPSQPYDPGEDAQRQALAICTDLVMLRDLAHQWRDGQPLEDPSFWFTKATGIRRPSADTALVDALAHAWTGYQRHGRAALRALGEPVAVDVELAGGYGIADLIGGHTLVDIKVTADPTGHLDEWLCQLLGYALLDQHDTWHLHTLAIYTGCQATLLTCPLPDLLRTASRTQTPTLPDLREQFHDAIRPDLDRYASRKQHHPR